MYKMARADACVGAPAWSAPFDPRRQPPPFSLFGPAPIRPNFHPAAKNSTTSVSRFGAKFRPLKFGRSRRNPTSAAAAMLLPEYPIASDVCATALSSGIALSLLRFWGETAKRGFFDQGAIRTRYHAFMFHEYSHLQDFTTEDISLQAEENCWINYFHHLAFVWMLGVLEGMQLLIFSTPCILMFLYLRITCDDAALKLIRKLVHVSIGLAFMLCWPLFSPGRRGALLAALVPGVNIIRVLLVGLGIWKDEATVKSMSRYGDYRELLKGPLYYAASITLACMVYWRTSPIAIATICNLCAGDGLADIVGRRFGSHKIPYNRNKSLVGSIAMASGGFLACIGYMYYFSSFGFVQENWEMVFGFMVVSLASAFVESLPISTELDDNLTVPLTSVLVGSLVF